MLAALQLLYGHELRGRPGRDVRLRRPLVANQGANTVSILYGGTNGSFTAGPQVALAGTAPTQVLVTNIWRWPRPPATACTC